MDRRIRQPLRVRPDENAIARQTSRIQLKPVTTLPIVSNNADKLGLKAGAKRVALGDVSNAVKPASNIAAGGKLVQQLPSKQTVQPVSRKSSRTALSSQTNVNRAHTHESQTADIAARDSRHHVTTAQVAEVYERMHKTKQSSIEPEYEEDDSIAIVEKAVSAVQFSSDSALDIHEQEEAEVDDTKELLVANTSSILNNLDSTDFTVQSTTNPGALFPVISDKTRAEYEQVAINFLQSEEAKALEPDYEGDEDWYDVSMVSEYSEEIFVYMRELEIKSRPNPAYMDNQTEIHWSMRSILVDWLVEVHNRLNLLPETLFLTINYIDRFLSLKVVSLAKLQLVGATALFVAAKYEEINCPSVQEITFMVDYSYTAEEIFKAERFMISLLEFNLGWPGPMSFLRRTSKADDYDLDTRTLAKYILEVTIMDERFVGAPPSWLAAAAHCLSRKILNRGEWTDAHVYYSGFLLSQLRPAMNVLVECLRTPKDHHRAIYEKYSDRKFKKASLYVSEWIAGVYN
ncbi:cyclin-like protein [Myxozyma melibiosi]|uniref:Cyclin-like protein n=1 Tax=Myxozyma melibiosi TaxID=54550 RepID=A0ABR1EZV5_9ASCO